MLEASIMDSAMCTQGHQHSRASVSELEMHLPFGKVILVHEWRIPGKILGPDWWGLIGGA